MPITSNLATRPRLFNAMHKLGLVRAVTQTSKAERAALCRHIANSSSAIEIGTFMGVTAAEMAAALPPHGKLYCIDPYPSADCLLHVARREMRRKGVHDRVSFLRCTSREALSRLPESIDFAFIDGDHSYDGLRNDWLIVRQLLRGGGIAAFHDTNRVADFVNTSGAIEFYDEVISSDRDFDHLETVASLNVLRRRTAQ